MPSAASLEQLKERLCRREHLDHAECEKASLPTLEHASLVHSHLHHPNGITDGQDSAAMASTASGVEAAADSYDQTRNAIVYISLVVIVYVVVILWLVSANFRSAAVVAASNSRRKGFTRRFFDAVAGTFNGDSDEEEELIEAEALLVVQDEKCRKKPRVTTYFEEECEGDPV